MAQRMQLTLVMLLIATKILSQDSIIIRNPGFEITSMDSFSVLQDTAWFDCGAIFFPYDSPPDLLTPEKGKWGVKVEPAEGNYYLGMVVRFDTTWESIAQKLERPLEQHRCYTITMSLAQSKVYLSGTKRSTAELERFLNPVKVLIWGGNDYCYRSQLLAETEPITNLDWKEFTLGLYPVKNFNYIMVQVYFRDGDKRPYNGHVLIDNISPIRRIDCY